VAAANHRDDRWPCRTDLRRNSRSRTTVRALELARASEPPADNSSKRRDQLRLFAPQPQWSGCAAAGCRCRSRSVSSLVQAHGHQRHHVRARYRPRSGRPHPSRWQARCDQARQPVAPGSVPSPEMSREISSRLDSSRCTRRDGAGNCQESHECLRTIPEPQPVGGRHAEQFGDTRSRGTGGGSRSHDEVDLSGYCRRCRRAASVAVARCGAQQSQPPRGVNVVRTAGPQPAGCVGGRRTAICRAEPRISVRLSMPSEESFSGDGRCVPRRIRPARRPTAAYRVTDPRGQVRIPVHGRPRRAAGDTADTDRRAIPVSSRQGGLR